MAVSILGRVTGPTGKPVSVALNATPVPNPSRTQAGDIVVGGLLADAQDGNVNASLTPGRYVLTVTTAAAAILAEREVQLTDGQVMKIGELLAHGSQPTPAPQTGGTVIVDAEFTAPTGWDTLLQPYYQGTMRFVILTGSWAETMEVTTSKPVTGSWAAIVVRGGGQPVIGAVKKRNEEPVESTTVTAPVVETEGLALAVACERTSAPETDQQISVSAGWEKLVSAMQDGEAWETIVVARRTATGSDQAIFTYPNVQGTNGAGVQVVIPK